MNIQSEFLLLLLFSVSISGLLAEPLVKISQGLLKGTIFESRKGRNVSAFIGVPYAQPPTGELRFSNPLPAKKWNGVFSANKEANLCPQNYYGKYMGDEDCLYLNVFTPVMDFESIKDSGNYKNNLLPVMVFVHGGGYVQEGSNLTAYSPKYLMEKDIIFVSMNYRLGVLGFLSTADSVAPGNFGLKDQVLALKWVQKNIQFFGGDPNRVTLFGNSAGALSVNLHALSDATDGLFQQYIIQSGSSMYPGYFRNRNEYKSLLKHMAKKLNCSSINSKVLVKCLRRKSVRRIMNAVNSDDDINSFEWKPTNEVESNDAFLADTPLNLLKQNKMKDLPFMTGTTIDEGVMVTFEYHTNWTTEPMADYLEEYINSSSNYYMKRDLTKYRSLVKDFYFSEAISDMSEKELLINFTKFGGDVEFFYPEMILLDHMVKTVKSPIFYYCFGYRGDTTLMTIEFNITANIGVTHAEELIYLFPKGRLGNFTEKDEKVLYLMVDLWTSFAINGQPTSDELDDPNLWLPFNENRSFLQIGNVKNNTDPSVTLDQDIFSDRMNFWRENFPIPSQGAQTYINIFRTFQIRSMSGKQTL